MLAAWAFPADTSSAPWDLAGRWGGSAAVLLSSMIGILGIVTKHRLLQGSFRTREFLESAWLLLSLAA